MMNIKHIVLISMVLFVSANASGGYIGCFVDYIPRDLDHYLGRGYTIDSCTFECGDKGYLYSALQNRGQCYCGNDYGSYGKCAESHCNRPCTENPDQICGGALRNSIYHSQFLDCIPIGNDCKTEVEIQTCHDHLGELDVGDISNECVPYVENNETYYRFELRYVNGYKLDEDCLSQTVDVEQNEIPGLLHVPETDGELEHFLDGATIYSDLPNEHFTYVADEDLVYFTIKHNDMESLGCQKFTEDDEYVWQCDFTLHIYFVGIEQYEYTFCMTVTLSRVYENALTVNVNPNQVIGDCCENELSIDTTLRYCEDFTCANYLPDGLVIERKSDIFVEHSIVTPEFQYYFLHGLQIKIGPFIPAIIATDASQEGRIIYHLQSNVALDSMIIEAISRIDENPQQIRRRQLSEIGEDYRLKSTNMISIIEDESNEKDARDSDDEVEIEKEVIIGAAVGGTVLLAIIITAVVFLVLRSRKNNQNAETQNKDKNGENKAIQLPIHSRGPSIDTENLHSETNSMESNTVGINDTKRSSV